MDINFAELACGKGFSWQKIFKQVILGVRAPRSGASGARLCH